MSRGDHEHNAGRNLAVAFLLNLVFTLLEVAAGLWANSIAKRARRSQAVRIAKRGAPKQALHSTVAPSADFRLRHRIGPRLTEHCRQAQTRCVTASKPSFEIAGPETCSLG